MRCCCFWLKVPTVPHVLNKSNHCHPNIVGVLGWLYTDKAFLTFDVIRLRYQTTSMYPVYMLLSWNVAAATCCTSAAVKRSTCFRSDSSFFQLPALTWYEHSAAAMFVLERMPSTSVSFVACMANIKAVRPRAAKCASMLCPGIRRNNFMTCNQSLASQVLTAATNSVYVVTAMSPKAVLIQLHWGRNAYD